jgi:hypothetical protein
MIFLVGHVLSSCFVRHFFDSRRVAGLVRMSIIYSSTTIEAPMGDCTRGFAPDFSYWGS